MDHTVRRALTGTADHPTLTFERVYRASPADIRSACTSIERLARWFGEVRGEPGAVGDLFTASLSDDPDDLATGQVQRCEDNVIAVTWSWQGESESVITARIVAVDEEHTRLTLRHELTESAHAPGYGGGWEQVLQALARTLGDALASAAPDEQIEADAISQWRTIMRAPLRVERIVPAPVDRVWSAFTTVDGLRSWWWRHWSDVRIEVDLREDGWYRIQAPGAGIEVCGRYLTVEQPRHLAYTWRWRDAHEEAPDEAVDIQFEPAAEGTRIIVRHSGPWIDDTPAQSYRQGWIFTLDQLTTSLE